MVKARHTPFPLDGAPPLRPQLGNELCPPETAILGLVAGLTFIAHMLVAGNYGYYIDELYFIADGHHLQAGYVDQPLLIGWLAALVRVIAGDGLVAIHVVPALAAALLVVFTGFMARELGGGRVAQLTAATAAMFSVIFIAFGSLFTMDVLDQLWWTIIGFVVMRLLRLNTPRLWLVIGLVLAVALLTKLTALFLGLGLALALLVTPARRYLGTPWPWLAAGIAFLGLLPYLIWNATNGWPTWEFWHHYGRFSTTVLIFFFSQIIQMNPLAFPLAVAGLVWYFRPAGARYQPLGWMFVFLYIILTVLHVKSYFIAPMYPALFAAGAVAFEHLRLRPWLGWLRPAYLAAIALAGILIAPDVMPILPPATLARDYSFYSEDLGDRFGWNTLTQTVERVYAGLPRAERAQSCVLTHDYGQASGLQLLASPGRLPPVISGHNNYYVWGPGTCTGKSLIVVGYAPAFVRHMAKGYRRLTLAAIHRCRYCVPAERKVRIYVLSGAAAPVFPRVWPSLKHFD